MRQKGARAGRATPAWSPGAQRSGPPTPVRPAVCLSVSNQSSLGHKVQTAMEVEKKQEVMAMKKGGAHKAYGMEMEVPSPIVQQGVCPSVFFSACSSCVQSTPDEGEG